MLRLAFVSLVWVLRLPFTLARWAVTRVIARKRRYTLRIELEGPHPHRPLPRSPLRPSTHGLSRWGLRTIVDRALDDPRVEAVQVRFGAMPGGWAGLFELREALARLEAAGKPVTAFLDHPDTRALWVASAASRLHIAPDSALNILGIGAEMTFFGDALDRAGVDVEVLAAGTYKSAMEPFVRVAPSPANREAIESLLGDLHTRIMGDLAAARGLSVEAVQAAFAEAPLSPADALDRGLIDAVSDEEEALPPERDGARHLLDAETYAGRVRALPRLRFRRPRLAMVEIRGAIRDGRHDDPNPQGATERAVVTALERARKRKRIKGVLLHIDSPGGSAHASERMWRAVRRLAAEKPVVAWMGDVAASGGYYVASGAHAIVAAPTTLTGSIGVIAARPSLGRLLGRLGIHRTRFELDPRAHMFSPGRRLRDGEKLALERYIADTYGLFLRRVAEGRDTTPEAVAPLAEGRVWTGNQALEHGLVDTLGDERVALTDLAARAGVPLGLEPHVQVIGPKRRLSTLLRPLLGAEAPVLSMLRMAAESRALAWCPLRLR